MWEKRSYLPWRKTKDPYKILVSEVMLQQTQVERVIPFYNRFVKKYPTARALARAPLRDVLRVWSGLGYNRRAKYLHEAAKILSGAPPSRKKSGLPGPAAVEGPDRRSEDFWRDGVVKLPGVGPYTRGAVLAFAFNQPEVFVETNIRTVFFYHSNILQNTRMSDAELLPLVKEALKRSKMQPREFYAAMMDYGAHLKKSGVRLNHRSKHYAKQSKFEGSRRQARAAQLRRALARGASQRELEVILHGK